MCARPKEFTRIDSDFFSCGTRCAGWLYLPNGLKYPPVVVMGHGLAAERTFRLPAYAERFAERGMAVFVFDYRYFGGSDGEPRNLISPSRQLQDWRAAIDHVRSIPGINQSRMALWGTSFSGGHVMVTAAQDTDITVVVAQVPFFDSLSLLKMVGLRNIARTSIAAVGDVFRMVTSHGAHYIPVAGEPGSFALITAPDFESGYYEIVPEGYSWRNECPARIFFTVPFYRPILKAKRVKCPTLILMAEKDTIIRPKSLVKAAAKLKNVKLMRMPVGHFDVYTGDGFDRAVEIETYFLKKHLIIAE